jgi:multiple sugar transport system permease protein
MEESEVVPKAKAVSSGSRLSPSARLPKSESLNRFVRLPLLYLVSTILGLMFLFPFFYTFMSSLKEPFELFTVPPTIVPKRLQWVNYVETVSMDMAPYDLWFYNTVVITVLSTTGGVLTSCLVAFGFARFRFRFKDALFMITLSTLMMPAQVTLIPRYIMFFKFGQWTGVPFLDTFKPLWLPSWFGGGAFAIFLMRQFMQTLPRDLDEAALIDGASYPGIFLKIVAPLCKPAIATLTIISVIGKWNSFMEPMIYLNTSDKFPISVGIEFFHITGAGQTMAKPMQHYLMCASVLSTIVPITIFFLFQRYFVQGVVMSGIKG